MADVGIRALKQNPSKAVAAALAGEVVTISVRGRQVAQLVPTPESDMEALVAADLARPALRSLADLPAPERRRGGDRSLSEELARARESERY